MGRFGGISSFVTVLLALAPGALLPLAAAGQSPHGAGSADTVRVAALPDSGEAVAPSGTDAPSTPRSPAPPETTDPVPTDSSAAPPLPEVELSVSGFISATAFAQDRSFGFGNGQSALFAASRSGAPDPWFMGGDVRSTRLRLTADAPDGVSGWTARGVLEIDFFGSFNGTGAFNDEQPQPRMRLAYVDLVRGGTTVRVGQSWTPLLGAVPVSVTHLAFPLGLGAAGLVGWRYPGLLVEQRVLDSSDPVSLTLQLGAFRGSWAGTDDDDPAQVVDHRSAGEAGVPQLEARIDVAGSAAGTAWRAYLVGHLDRKDLSGVGDRYDTDDQLVGSAVELGGRVDRGRWTVQGNGYAGRAVGQQFGALTQFGDIGSHGGWVQVGYDLVPRLGLWLFHGFEDPLDADVRASGNARLRNRSTAVALQWDEGPWQAGLEWLGATTRWAEGDTSADDRSGQQISFSVLYAF